MSLSLELCDDLQSCDGWGNLIVNTARASVQMRYLLFLHCFRKELITNFLSDIVISCLTVLVISTVGEK